MERPTMSQTMRKKRSRAQAPSSTNRRSSHSKTIYSLLFTLFLASSTVCMFLGILRPSASKSMPKTPPKSSQFGPGTSPRNGIETVTTQRMKFGLLVPKTLHSGICKSFQNQRKYGSGPNATFLLLPWSPKVLSRCQNGPPGR